MSLAEEESGQGTFGLLQMFGGRADMAEIIADDAELQMDLLLLWSGGDGKPLLKDVRDFLEVADLRAALGQSLAEFPDHAAFKVLALDQKRPQINEGFRHDSLSREPTPGRHPRVGERWGSAATGRALPRVGRSRENQPENVHAEE